MKDIIIGIKKSKSCSAVVYYQYSEVQNIISHNSELYWCRENFTGTTIFILKNTNEGEALTALLHCKSPVECIENFLLNITLNNMNISDLRDLMENLSEKYFERGVRFNQQQLRMVMGY